MKRGGPLRRTPLNPRRSGPPRRVGALTVAREERAPEFDWTATRAVVAGRDAYRCRRCGADCSVSAEVHHRIAKGMGGASNDPRRDAPASCVLLCTACHHTVHHPTDTDAYDAIVAAGYVIPRRGGGDSRAVPLRTVTGVYLLDDLGGQERVW